MYIIRILSVCSVAASRLGPFGWELTEELGYQLSHRCISATGELILADEYRISILTHQSIKSEFGILLMIQILTETERGRGREGESQVEVHACFFSMHMQTRT